MVTRFGMSDVLGPVALGRQQGNPFLGRDIASERDFSEKTAASIDKEVRSLADMLVDKETVDSEELQQLLATSDVKMASIA